MAVESVAQVEYRDIPGFDGYRAGSDGSIWSCWKKGVPPGVAIGESYESEKDNHWRQLRCKRHVRSGHVEVTVRKNRRRVYAKAHQLVLFAFVGPKPPGLICRHLNGNPSDNRIENICWGTYKENLQDTIRHGRFPWQRAG